MATYSLTLRGEKGQKLTAQELDNNFLYVLENATGGSAPLVEFESGFDSNIFSGFYEIEQKFTTLGQTSSAWRLLASAPLLEGPQGPTNVYVKYIGKIVAPVEAESMIISTQQNSFYSSDNDFDRVTSHFGPGGLVTDYDSGTPFAVPFGVIVDTDLVKPTHQEVSV
jgi:hypothetical protein